MKSEKFSEIVSARCAEIQTRLCRKAAEYAAGDDRLYNFKRAAEIGRTEPEKALWGMLLKHLVSIIDMVEGRTLPAEYLIDEKIGDAIAYLCLLEAVLREKISVPESSVYRISDFGEEEDNDEIN